MGSLIKSALPDNPMNLWFLLLFVAVFVGIVAWTLRPSKRVELQETSRQPFND